MWNYLFPLIGTRNRHLSALAQDVYYSRNTFQVYICNEESPANPASYFRSPKSIVAGQIHHLSIYIEGYADQTLEGMLLDRQDSW